MDGLYVGVQFFSKFEQERRNAHGILYVKPVWKYADFRRTWESRQVHGKKIETHGWPA